MKHKEVRSDNQLTPQEWRTSGVLSGVYALRMLGLFLVLPVLALHAAALAGSDQSMWIGWIMGAYGLTQACLQLPFGMLSDKIGRKKTIYIGMLIFVVGSFLAAIAETLWVLMLARALQGAGAISAVITAMMADLIREQVRTRAMAMVGMSIGLTFAGSLVAAPLLSGLIGVEGLFVLTGVAMLAAMYAVHRFVPDPEQVTVRNRLPALQIGLQPQLWRLNFGIFALHAGQMSLFICLPFLLLQMGWAQEEQWKVYAPMVLFGMFLMVPIIMFGEKKRQLKPTLLLAIGMMIVAQGVLAWQSVGTIVLMTALVLYAIAFNVLEAILPSMVAKFAPPEQRGAAMGFYSTAQSLGIFVGGLVGGLLLSQMGLSGVFIFATVLMLAWWAIAYTGQAPQVRQA
ncbi:MULTISPECIES: MFS transporter [Vitreoscilla]|uniref:MFS transporter n=1 Tax=Vitreoscilla stercoraria TaxID=61 RepID=A0ABY4EI21_VITST|nr:MULTISPECIES: MFS transporter [Vitreoscilla]QJQ52331.1 MFS transporter [Vitreoscilla sp. C1]UOO93027.1 MFS transporter [Vitreoscilla stercoraria]